MTGRKYVTGEEKLGPGTYACETSVIFLRKSQHMDTPRYRWTRRGNMCRVSTRWSHWQRRLDISQAKKSDSYKGNMRSLLFKKPSHYHVPLSLQLAVIHLQARRLACTVRGSPGSGNIVHLMSARWALSVVAQYIPDICRYVCGGGGGGGVLHTQTWAPGKLITGGGQQTSYRGVFIITGSTRRSQSFGRTLMGCICSRDVDLAGTGSGCGKTGQP